MRLPKSTTVWAAIAWGCAIIAVYVGIALDSQPKAIEVPIQEWDLEEYSQPIDPMRDLTTTGRLF